MFSFNQIQQKSRNNARIEPMYLSAFSYDYTLDSYPCWYSMAGFLAEAASYFCFFRILFIQRQLSSLPWTVSEICRFPQAKKPILFWPALYISEVKWALQTEIGVGIPVCFALGHWTNHSSDQSLISKREKQLQKTIFLFSVLVPLVG